MMTSKILQVVLAGICVAGLAVADSTADKCDKEPELLVYFEGEEKGKLRRSSGPSSLFLVEYNRQLDIKSFKATLNGKDVTNKFLLDDSTQIPRVNLPLEVGANQLELKGILLPEPAIDKECREKRVLSQNLTIDYSLNAAQPIVQLKVLPGDKSFDEFKKYQGRVISGNSSEQY